MLKPGLQFEGPNLLREGLKAPMHREALMQQQPGENSSSFQLSQVKLSSTNIPHLQTVAVSGQQLVQDNLLCQANGWESSKGAA